MSSNNSNKRKDDKGRERAEKARDKREERRLARLARKRAKGEDPSESSPSGLWRCIGSAVRFNHLHGFKSHTLLVKARCGRCKHKVSHCDGKKCSKCPRGICRYVRED